MSVVEFFIYFFVPNQLWFLFVFLLRCILSTSLTQTPLPKSSTGDTANSLTCRYGTLANWQNTFKMLILGCVGSCYKVIKHATFCSTPSWFVFCWMRSVWPFATCLCSADAGAELTERSPLRWLHRNRKVGEIQSPVQEKKKHDIS